LLIRGEKKNVEVLKSLEMPEMLARLVDYFGRFVTRAPTQVSQNGDNVHQFQIG
jgi:hypothetical protein